MRKLLAITILVFTALVSAPALASGEALVVDGSTYYSYKLSGTAYHWETPETDPTAAYFPLRDQIWTGNGSENLPCQYGIHWISNKNVLTVSHCLAQEEEEQSSTTTTTTPSVESTSTTSSVPTTTNVPPSSSVPTTTVIGPTTTSSPTPTIAPPSTLDPTTTVVAVTTPPVPTTQTTPDPGTVELPKTGGSWTMAGIAATLVALGALTLAASRRKEEDCSI